VRAPAISNPSITNATITGGNITGNVTVNSGIKIDTVDISVLKTTADSAVSAASAAQTTANTAVANAATAQATASSGVAKANAAQSTANTAVANAATAQSTANSGVSKANTAQSTANSGVSKANAAQSTANTAVSNAATAQSTANTAVSKANTAQSTANAKVSKSGDTMGNLQVNGSIGVTGTVDGVDVSVLGSTVGGHEGRLQILEKTKPTPTIVAWALIKCRGGGSVGQTCPLGGRHNVSKVVIVGDFFMDVYFKTPLQTTDYAVSTTIVNSSVGNDASVMHMKKNYVRVDTGTSHDFTVLVIENRLK